MKIGFVVTCFYDNKLRPRGQEFLDKFLTSIEDHVNFDHTVYVVDNASPYDLSISYDKCKVIKINEHRGITNAWNIGVLESRNDSNIIVNCNDDLVVTESINTFIETIANHVHNDVSIYGPVCNKEGVSTPHQIRSGPGKSIIETTNEYALNGFFLAFTDKFYDRFSVNGNLFSTDKKYSICANENEIQERVWKQGGRSFILETGYIIHDKQRGWQKLL